MEREEIYKELLNSIFEQDEEKFIKIIAKNFDLFLYNYGGYYLIHYLFDYYWEEGIAFYKSKNLPLDLLTVDKIISLNGIPMYVTGGQNFLHIVARKDKTLYQEIKSGYEFLQTPDNNSELPEDIYHAKNNFEFFRERYNRLLQRKHIKCENNLHLKIKSKEIIDPNITRFELDPEVILQMKNQIEQIEERIPNSMHKYGKVIYPTMKCIIDSVVQELLPCTNNMVDIHSFYIKYNPSVQKNLDKHRDDSTYTINICLSNSSNEGKLIFDDMNYSYAHQECFGILHSGTLYHHVEDIGVGQRENVIIWVKCL
jgi:hypothetical protein